jgi:hypothetical protein
MKDNPQLMFKQLMEDVRADPKYIVQAVPDLMLTLFRDPKYTERALEYLATDGVICRETRRRTNTLQSVGPHPKRMSRQQR